MQRLFEKSNHVVTKARFS